MIPRYLLPKIGDPQEKRINLEKNGFIMDEDRRQGRTCYYFQANIFADYLGKCLTCVEVEDHNIYIYNRRGYYQLSNNELFGKLVKFLMGQYDQLWSRCAILFSDDCTPPDTDRSDRDRQNVYGILCGKVSAVKPHSLLNEFGAGFAVVIFI